MKQKLNAENKLDSANAHIASLTQTSGVYEAKLQEATEKLIDLTKLQVQKTIRIDEKKKEERGNGEKKRERDMKENQGFKLILL